MICAASPRRVQMTRRVPWRPMNPAAVIVSRPYTWGNPYRFGQCHRIHGPSPHWHVYDADHNELPLEPVDRDEALAWSIFLFFEYMKEPGRTQQARTQLRGRDLACWCPLTQVCHGDVLLHIANNATPLDISALITVPSPRAGDDRW